MRATRLLIVLATLAGCLTMGAPAQARVPQSFIGIVLNAPVYPAAPGVDVPRQLDLMARSGAENVVLEVSWADIQPYATWADVPASETSQFTTVDGLPLRLGSLDTIVRLLTARGLSILPRVLNAPSWDALPPRGEVVGTPARVAPYAAFLTALIHRYGPHGSFWTGSVPRRPIRQWQVWNEPNLWGWWSVQPNFAPSYVALLKAAHDAIKAADRGARVILAGLADSSWIDLGKIYAVRGVRSLFDVVAIHPYTARPAGVLTILDNVRAVMAHAHDSRKPMVADEVGWNSSLGKSSDHFGVETDEAGQARKLDAVIQILNQRRRRLRLLGFDVYDWAGTEQRGSYEFNFAGLFRFAGGVFVAKPAYRVFRRDALRLEGCRVKASATRCIRRA